MYNNHKKYAILFKKIKGAEPIDIKYSHATIDDLPRIVEIYNQSIASKRSTGDLEPITVESRIPWFEAHHADSRPLWVMTHDDHIVGWIGLSEFYGRPAYHRTAEISIYLDPVTRGQHLGQDALAFVETQLEHLKIRTLVALVFDVNQASKKLFLKNGYELWGHLPQIADMGDHEIGLVILGKTYLNQ
ncbi:phosphinothricin acetyltransferase [Enterococcus sp. DIV2381]